MADLNRLIRGHIDRAAAKAASRPSLGQKEAGNYRVGKIRFHGLDISIENPRGSTRSGIGKDGKPWRVALPDHYGYIRRTEGSDGDHVDCYIGCHPMSSRVFVIDQVDADSKEHDEHKCMLGYTSEEQALSAYRRAFSDGRGNDRIGSVKEMDVAQFKRWLQRVGGLPKYASGGSVRMSGSSYNTQLSPLDEMSYRQWVKDNNVPTDPDATAPQDYDMRGFYQGLQQQNPKAQSAVDPNDSRLHYPDYWKTPSHQTFSNESQWAPTDAPQWTDDDKLVQPNGKVVFDDRNPPSQAEQLLTVQNKAHGGPVHMADGGSPGMFDDLVPDKPATAAPPAAPDHGMFSDLVPGNKLDRPDEKPLIGDGGQFSSGTDWGNNFADAASKTAFNAMKNAPASAVNFARDVVQPIIHPVDTATNLKNLGLGVLEKAGVTAGDSHEKYANAVGKFFSDRYGGFENARHTLETDPVGMAGDLSAVLSGGETVLGRLPGVVGKVGEVAGDVGRATDPLRAAAPVAETAGSVAGNTAAQVLGVTTGVGADPLKVAAGAGYKGGAPGQAFRENITGAAPLSDAVDEARGAVSKLRQERGNAYRTAMEKMNLEDSALGPENRILDFGKIDESVDKVSGIKNFKGQDLSPATKEIRSQMTDAINEWRELPSHEFHTVEGLDALKQKLGDIRDNTLPNTPARVVADQIYQGVRKTIIDQAPDYAKVMKGYEEASKQIKEIETTLSLKPNANVDTALRKLQSTLRDNVNTSFGRRAELANFLVNAGAPNLMEKLAGQALHSWVPRGLARLATMETIPAAAGAFGAGATGAGAAAAATLPLMSPRLVGNAAYRAGVASRFARPIISGGIRPARQVGRVTEPFWKPGNPYAQQ